jgi:hypothetical protein
MASWSASTIRRVFAAFAALDLGLLFALSSEAVREARLADPAGMLGMFAAMKAAAVCGLMLLVAWAIAAAIRTPFRSALQWWRHVSSQELADVEA